MRRATLLTKEQKEWTLKHNTRHNRYWLCIEDPFETSHNLGRVADRNTYVYLVVLPHLLRQDFSSAGHGTVRVGCILSCQARELCVLR